MMIDIREVAVGDPDPRWEKDLSHVKDILEGSRHHWDDFVDEYANDVLAVARRWCGSRCLEKCPLQRRGFSNLFRTFRTLVENRQECDEASEAFHFIFLKMRYKCLPRYSGKCSLRTFLYPLFLPKSERNDISNRIRYGFEQLYADYIRETKGRVRVPKAVIELGDFYEEKSYAELYILMCYGYPDDVIADRLKMRAECLDAVARARCRIEEMFGFAHFHQYESRRPLVVVGGEMGKFGSELDESPAGVVDSTAAPDRTEEAAIAICLMAAAVGRLLPQVHRVVTLR
jgi:hypothetical protein